MKDVRKLKGLQSQLNTMVADSELLKIDLTNKQKEYNQKLNSINNLKKELRKLENNNNLKVSEHAILRYFERVKGFNIEEIEKEILNENVISLVEKLGGNGKYPNNNFSVVMKDYTVTTIV